ncbi:hypothetical protein C8F01DRAFT_1368906 [Mycena amicta]|nr:hypothetical protein C8F01DRAFT_1368906 [Mycena amicta]
MPEPPPLVEIQHHSPIQELPEELLTEIFSKVDTGGNDDSPLKLATRLSGVCGYWRQLVLHTPRLWTTVVIKLQFVNLSVEYRTMVKELLERSSPHPVDISFYRVGRRPEQRFLAPVMDAVLSVAPRWGRIKFDFDILATLQTVASLPLLRLTSMDLNFGFGYVQQPSQSSSFFLDAPRLTRVSLCMSDFSLLPMPWSQLTDLSLFNHTTSSREFLDIIPQCSILVHLQLVIIAWHDDDDLNFPVPTRVVLLPNLLDLELDPAQPSDDDSRWQYTFEPFFARFSFPALTKLSITMESSETIILGDAFAEFLRRSPHLDSLRISHCEMDEEDMDGVLRNIPSLTTLVRRRAFDT